MKQYRFGPKGKLSPTLGDPCALCGAPLEEGEFTTLMSRTSDRPGAEVHWDCAVEAESAPRVCQAAS